MPLKFSHGNGIPLLTFKNIGSILFFPLLNSLSLFFRTVFQRTFCHCLFPQPTPPPLFFLWRKIPPQHSFSLYLPQEYKPTTVTTSSQKQAVLGSFVSSRATDSKPSHLHFHISIIWASKVKITDRSIASGGPGRDRTTSVFQYHTNTFQVHLDEYSVT